MAVDVGGVVCQARGCRECGSPVEPDKPERFPPSLRFPPFCEECQRALEAQYALAQQAERSRLAATKREILGDAEHQAVLGIPALYAHARLNDVDRKPRGALRQLGDGGLKLLTLHGGRGAGKTYAALALCRELLLAAPPVVVLDAFDRRDSFGLPFVFWPMPALVDRLRSEAMHERPAGTLDRLCKMTRLVVLDDLAACRVTPFAVECAARLVSEREAARLPLLVTLDTPFGELGACAPGLDRVASRLAGGAVLHFTGADRRLARSDTCQR